MMVAASSTITGSPWACTCRNESPASAVKTARSVTSVSYSAAPVRPCAGAFAATRARAHRSVWAPSCDISAPAVSPSARTRVATKTTLRGGRLTRSCPREGGRVPFCRRACHLASRRSTRTWACRNARSCGKVRREERCMRTGEDYVDALQDGRTVLLDGERVKDVASHPAFAAPIRTVAATYDAARSPAGADATWVGDDGVRRSTMWLVPRSADDLAARRRCHRLWAERSYGLMGRTPDHVACVLTAFASWRRLFDRGGRRFGDNVVRFHEKARDEDLYVAYAIVPPQVDRTQPAHRHPEPFLHPGVVRECDGGIVLRGCQAIATSAVMADWLFLSYITPLVAGDEDYAISVVMPMSAEGLRLYPRRPYQTQATSVYDYPLSSRFDEVDTTIVLDDVFVPWEHVFIYRDIGLVNAQFHETPSHTLANFQSLVRFAVKCEFLAGLALKLAEVQRGEGQPATQATLGGDIAALCATFDALAQAAERNPLLTDGVARPHPQFIYAGMSLQRRLIVDLMRSVRELAGGAFQALPSSNEAFTSGQTRTDTERYYRSAAAPARDRVKLLKLAWDFVGTEFGGRQLQYEMFYSASQPIVNSRMFKSYDWAAATALVDRCLAEYD